MFRPGLFLLAAVALQADPVEQGRNLTDWDSAEAMAALTAAASPDVQGLIDQIGGAEVIGQQLGEELEALDEFAFGLNGLTYYRRLSRFANAPYMISSAVWDETGEVVEVSAAAAPAPLSSGPATWPVTRFSLVFNARDGVEWLTSWGGANAARNYHVVALDQRYAYDFKLTRDGWSYLGSRFDNTSYYCWGQPVYAPAAGRVITVVNDIADNATVGEMNTRAPAGNHVIIEHAPGEYSLTAHFRQGTVAVEEGQTIAAGSLLGECGNSGNSSEPHIHFHLQDSPAFGQGRGLPAPFSNYMADGAVVERGIPLRGQLVAPAR